MENFFLNLGLSYTWSKLLPFIIVTIIGLILGIYVFKKSKNKLVKVAGILLIFVPFAIYFAMNPIYQGDFTNDAEVSTIDEKTAELKDKKFVVVAMAGCPYCFQAIGFLKEFQEKNKNVHVEFLVASSDSTSLLPYKNEINGAFKISLAEKPQEIGSLVKGRFPSYVSIQGQEISVWSNNNFGVRALDKVVANFN